MSTPSREDRHSCGGDKYTSQVDDGADIAMNIDGSDAGANLMKRFRGLSGTLGPVAILERGTGGLDLTADERRQHALAMLATVKRTTSPKISLWRRMVTLYETARGHS